MSVGYIDLGLTPKTTDFLPPVRNRTPTHVQFNEESEGAAPPTTGIMDAVKDSAQRVADSLYTIYSGIPTTQGETIVTHTRDAPHSEVPVTPDGHLDTSKIHTVVEGEDHYDSPVYFEAMPHHNEVRVAGILSFIEMLGIFK